MNKIVRRFYPVEKLPADLKSGLPEHGWVHIEIDPEVRSDAAEITNLVGTGRNVHGNEQAVLGHIRSLREDR